MSQIKTISEFANVPEGLKMPDSLIKALNSGKRQCIMYPRRFGQNTAYKLVEEYRIFNSMKKKAQI